MTNQLNLSGFTKEEISECLDEIRHPIEVAVYGIKNYYNAGAIIRNCHNFLVKKVYLIDLNDVYRKAAMCTWKYERHNIERFNLRDFVDYAKTKNLISCERRHGLKSQDIRRYNYPDNPILVFGSENFGVPKEIAEISKGIISIPVFGLINDFNVAQACGIILYDWITKYYKKNK